MILNVPSNTNHNTSQHTLMVMSVSSIGANLNNVQRVYLHMPFITIIGVIKEENLWAKFWQAFYGLLLPWCLSILVSKLCITLIPATPSPATSSSHLPRSTVLWLSALSKATSPYL